MTDTKHIAFIGVGTMGWPMAANLVRGGYAVTAFDLRNEQAGRWAKEHGASWTADLAELGKRADAVVTMLPSGREVRDALLHLQDGALVAHLRKGALVIDMSSADPVGTQQLGQELAQSGIAMVDAPVSGLVTRAREGTLTIMIGGAPEAVAAAKPILACMGKNLFEVGGPGCGHAMKALNNFLGATNLAAAAEALRIGKTFGLDPAIMTEVINVSSGRSAMSELMIKDQVLTGRFASGFALGLLVKDAGIAADLAEQIGADNPMGRLTRDLWIEARDAIGAESDHTEAARAWEMTRASKRS